MNVADPEPVLALKGIKAYSEDVDAFKQNDVPDSLVTTCPTVSVSAAPQSVVVFETGGVDVGAAVVASLQPTTTVTARQAIAEATRTRRRRNRKRNIEIMIEHQMA
ncbi:MAG TPA: hypothetical protein VK636_20850 [Gemmatimonadaceae bacterium]|nr:hypothetical protein [Gemmatimonadaceae bacterium]